MEYDSTEKDYEKVVRVVPEIEKVRMVHQIDVTNCQIDEDTGSFEVEGEVNQWQIGSIQNHLMDNPYVLSVYGEYYHTDTSYGWVRIEGLLTAAQAA